MGALDAVAGRVAGGASVRFRPSGSSMVPLIRSRQQVTVVPVDPSKVEVGDIALARVAGTVYVHLVSAVDPARKRVQISNNRGHVNGWTGHGRGPRHLHGGRRRTSPSDGRQAPGLVTRP
ncbi:S26 family signal peptidase [Actinacidiphila glaucinigra]|uniref:S26 family signal peptidase n=1 Tax=Actinacidiphila glaucinigra TaxID=235986 RepID=UPI003815B5DB